MIDFQAAERRRLEEPASDIGLEPLCAMVSGSMLHAIAMHIFLLQLTSGCVKLTFAIKMFCYR